MSIHHIITDQNRMLATLQNWAEAGWIRWLDVEFARFLYQQTAHSEPASALLLLAAALASHQSGHGHVCLDLSHCLSEPARALALPPDHSNHIPEVRPDRVLAAITLQHWLAALQHTQIVAHGEGSSPLVLSTLSSVKRPMLYLRRFWRYEQQINQAIQRGLGYQPQIDEHALRRELDRLFPIDTSGRCNWQKIACALAIRHQFAIITGGPGTGKTTTVLRLLAALNALHQDPQPLRIRLAAPTGKAAVRLGEAITSQLANFDNATNIPTDVSTVHRLLGPVRHSRFFRHHAANPLPVDVVIVDEASMVDVELMAQLTDALPPQARLILLGDKDQLASVEAGAVLGSLCEQASKGRYTADTGSWVSAVTGETIADSYLDDAGTPLDQAITMLRYSHRFGAIPGIAALAEAVNNNADNALSLFAQYAELQHISVRNTHDAAFESLITDKSDGYGFYLGKLQMPVVPALTPELSPETRAILDDWAKTILEAFARFQLLAALRNGEFGVQALNQRIESVLRRSSLLQAHEPASAQQPDWYSGRPVMLTRNNYDLKLMNGDIGIALPWPDSNGSTGIRLRVAFPDNQQPNGIRWILPSRLQHVETVFAMTVHKSQGSEFSHTALILPAYDSPILTRELIYTAITRASGSFTLLTADEHLLQTAIARRVFRVSGLAIPDSACR